MFELDQRALGELSYTHWLCDVSRLSIYPNFVIEDFYAQVDPMWNSLWIDIQNPKAT